MKNILKRTILNTLASSLVALLLLGTACTTDYSSNNPFDPGNAGKLASAYDLSATIVVNEIRLTWDNPTTASAVGEWVILRTDLTDNSEEIVLIAQEAANLSYNDNALTQTDASLRIVAGHEYEYRVAISSDGFALGGTESGTAGGVAITDLDEDGFWDDGDISGTIGDNLCAAGAV
ncbi:hypothetical protein KAI87_17945, partial [Myxococcota bacterium]|nr:hypothetical protein [Myxococcota bacterium]